MGEVDHLVVGAHLHPGERDLLCRVSKSPAQKQQQYQSHANCALESASASVHVIVAKTR